MRKYLVALVLLTCFVFPASAAVDLVIQGGIVPNGMTRGTSYNVTLYVQNTGNTSTTTSFYINISINTAGSYNGNQTYLTDILVNGGIGAGQQKTVSTTITIPCSFSAGTRYILAGADATGLVAESNNNNNNFSFPFLNRDLNTPSTNAASNVTGTSFQANWQSITEATGYTLTVASNSSFSNIVSGYNNLNVGNNTSRSVTGLNCNTNYYYRLQAINSCGTSPNVTSGQFVTTSACSSCPNQNAPNANAPSNQSAAGFRANWSSISGATGYRIDVSTNSSFSSYVSGYNNLNAGNSTSEDITGLNCNTTYYYRVRAYNSCGNTSGSSSTISASTSSCSCPTQAAPTISAASNQSQTGFRANWSSVSGASGYRIDVSTNNTFSSFVSGYNNLNAGNSTSEDITGLNCNTTYYYRVRAYNSCGNISGNSGAMTGTTTTCACPSQAAPNINSASNQSQTGFRANWSSVNGASGYRIDVSTNNSFSSFVSGYNNLNAGNSTSEDITGLSCNTTYYYRVRAYNSCGNISNNSGVEPGVTTSCSCVPPATPTGLTAQPVSETQVNLSWNAVTGATGYDILFCSGGYVTYVSAPSTSYNHNGLTGNTTYSYKIMAQKGGASCVSSLSNCVNTTTLPQATNPVPASIISPMPSLLNTSIYQLALPDAMYTASLNPVVCRPKYKCNEVFMYQSPSKPNNVAAENELLPKAKDCFTNLQNSWDFRQRGYITGKGSQMCTWLPCGSLAPNTVSHSQNACGGKDDRYAWDINLAASTADAGVCIYSIESGKVVGRGAHYLYLEHTNTNNEKWYSWYDNIKPSATLPVGSNVLKKQHIGHIGNHISAPHLHFGIYYKNTSGKLISVNRPINQNLSDINGAPYTSTNFNGTCTGSIISGASVYFKKEGEWFFATNTDENGSFRFTTIPGLLAGDSVKVIANGYEPLAVQVGPNPSEQLDFKFALIKKAISTGVINPKFFAVDNKPFFQTVTVPIKVLGSNYNTYSVFNVVSGEEEDQYNPMFTNKTFADSIITITLQDTGINRIAVSYYGADTITLHKAFVFNPVPSNSAILTINCDQPSAGAQLYINGQYIKKVSEGTQSVSLLPSENIVSFSKLGYKDTTLYIQSASTVNLKLVPVAAEIYSFSDSAIIDFAEDGPVQHWKKITVMDPAMKEKILIKQFEKNYSPLKLVPKSRTFEFKDLKTSEWWNIQFLAILDQATNYSENELYLLRVFDENKYHKLKFAAPNLSYDSNSQKLTYHYINFQNGVSSKEAIAVMKKQVAIIHEAPKVVIVMNDTLKVPLRLFVEDPDMLPNDIIISINNISITPDKFQLTIVDSFVHIKAGKNFVGDVTVNVSATHDFTLSTKNIKIKVLSPDWDNVLTIYPNPGSSIITADLLVNADGKYTLEMFDMQGRRIKTFFTNKTYTRGRHIEQISIEDIGDGVYIFRINDMQSVKFVKMPRK